MITMKQEIAYCPKGCELPKAEPGNLFYNETQILNRCCFCKCTLYDENDKFLGTIKKVE